jgi:hypothetical protein
MFIFSGVTVSNISVNVASTITGESLFQAVLGNTQAYGACSDFDASCLLVCVFSLCLSPSSFFFRPPSFIYFSFSLLSRLPPSFILFIFENFLSGSQLLRLQHLGSFQPNSSPNYVSVNSLQC